MQSHAGRNSKRNSALRGAALLWAVLTLGFGVLPAAAAPFAYVANFISNNVSVIDTAANPPSELRQRIRVGEGPSAVAVAPDGTHVYVTNTPDGTVSVIDTADNTLVATVRVRFHPVGVAVSPDGTRVYVSNSLDGTVSVINTANPRRPSLERTIQVGDTSGGAIAVTPNGRYLYVGCHGFAVYDTANNYTRVALVTRNAILEGFVASPDGTRIYGVSPQDHTFVAINTATNAVATVTVPNPRAVAVTPDGQRAYVTNITPNIVSVIDTASNTPVASIRVGSGPIAAGALFRRRSGRRQASTPMW
jgi:YVTN family beta-propeller protein